MQNLHLVLKYHWFDEIVSGKKTVEYRDIKPRWIERILKNKHLRKIIFHRGYSKITVEKLVDYIDIGPRPYVPNDENKIRIHLRSPESYTDTLAP